MAQEHDQEYQTNGSGVEIVLTSIDTINDKKYNFAYVYV